MDSVGLPRREAAADGGRIQSSLRGIVVDEIIYAFRGWNGMLLIHQGLDQSRREKRNNLNPAKLWLSQQRFNCKLILGAQARAAAAAARAEC